VDASDETYTKADALSVAMTAAFSEAITFHSLDNLTLQLVSSYTALYTLKLLGSFSDYFFKELALRFHV